MRWLCRIGLLLFIAAASAGCRCVAQGEVALSKDPLCVSAEARLKALDVRLAHEEALARRTDLLQFLNAIGEDPLDCVTRAAQSKLVDVERNLVQLTVQTTSIAPDWLYQCSRIDPGSQKCVGGSPYEDEIPRDTNEVIRTGHGVPMREQTARVSIAPGMACRIEAVSVSESEWFSIKGHPPRILARGAGTFPLEPIRHMRTPILIASIRCDDSLRFRKAAWLLTPEK